MRFVVVVVALPVLLVGWTLWSDHRIEQRLQPIASEIAGHPVSVDCQSIWGALIDAQSRAGEVQYRADGTPEPRLFLTHDTCKRLAGFAGHAHHAELDCLRAIEWRASDPLPLGSDCYARSSRTVYALLVVAHEAYHTAGVVDEAAANCDAIQAMAWTATRLGGAQDEAELAAQAMAALEPKQDLPYGSGECRPGRRLDLHPETPAFPTEQPLAPPRPAAAR